MPAPDERPRPHPSDRFAGAEHLLDIPASLRALRAEGRSGPNGHRQIALMHQGPVRLVLFAFDAGGGMKEHTAPGWVTIHVLAGRLSVRTPEQVHALCAGQLLSLAPGLPHLLHAEDEVDMLLGVYPEAAAGRD